MLSDRRWKQYVREGRSLILEGAAGRLRLGQIAQDIEPNGSAHGGDRRSSGTAVPLEEYAAEIDMEVETLRQYRDVLLKWGGDPGQCPKTSWTVLRELAVYDDPAGTYRAIKREHGIVNTVTVRITRGVPEWNHQAETPIASKARQARHLLSDPEVARAVIDDHETRVAITRAASSFQDDNKITNRPGAARVQRELEITHAPFFRALAAFGGAGFLSSIRAAARELALLIEHDVEVPVEVLDEAEAKAAVIAEHLTVLRMRVGVNAWAGEEV